jgi:thiamine kinase-like enzyme
LGQDGRIRELPIFCSAHSHESRKIVYDSLKFLWEKGFGKGYLTIPHALVYDEEYSAIFYRGVDGYNLYYYIRENNRSEIENIVPKAALWFSKLHQINTDHNFNPKNSRIETVLPGVKHLFGRIGHDYPHFASMIEKIYRALMEKERKFFDNPEKLYLIHGDAHPENIIRMSQRKIAVIDFTDLCLGDFARDVGSFLQQLEYMIKRKIGDDEYASRIKNLFLVEYLKNRQIDKSAEIGERIDIYYNWTAMRTATHFLIKHEPEAERAENLIRQVYKNIFGGEAEV